MIVKTLLQQTRLDKYTRIFVQIFIQSGPIKSFRKSLMEEFKFILPVLRFLNEFMYHTLCERVKASDYLIHKKLYKLFKYSMCNI